MATLHDIEQLLGKLTPGEKAQLLQQIARDLGGISPGIDIDPVVAGGEACIVRTRIPVWLLVQARRMGLSEAEILANYPSLHADDLTNAWNYARLHADEIDRNIRENESA